MKQTNAKR